MNIKEVIFALLPAIAIVKCQEELLPKPIRDNTLYEQCFFEILRRCVKSHEYKVALNLNPNYIDFNIHLGAWVIQTNIQQPLIQYEFRKFDAYLVIYKDDLGSIMKYLSQNSMWNPRAKFFIISEENPKKVFQVVLNYYASNVLILKKSKNKVDIFSYFPYTFLDTQAINTNPVLLDTCIEGVLQANSDLFPNKIPKKWTNFTLRVAAIRYPPYVTCTDCKENKGIEIETLEILRTVMDFEIEYVNKTYPMWGYKLDNGTYTDAFGDIQSYRADIGLGTFHTTHKEHLDFDMTFSYVEDDLKWVVPAAQPLKHFQSILLVFTGTTWTCLVVFVVLVAFITNLLSNYNALELQQFQNLIQNVLTSFQVLLGNSTILCPKTNAVRIVFAVWCISGCIFSAALQSKLLIAYSTKVFEKQVTSVQDILQSKMQFGFYDDVPLLYQQSADPDELFVIQNFKSCKVGFACINKTAYEKNFATMEAKRFLELVIPIYYLNPDGSSMLYIFDSNVVHALYFLFFTKGHPMFEQVNELIYYLKFTGVISHFYKNVEDYNSRMLYFNSNKNKIHLKALSFNQLHSIFALWIFGIVISIICLLCELYKARKNVQSK